MNDCWGLIMGLLFMSLDYVRNYITDMATSIVFNCCQTSSNNKYTQLLSLISIHPAFKAKVNEYF